MDDLDHKRLAQLESEGRILIGVDRTYARKLYTDVPISTIQRETGESPYFEKLVVWFAFLMSPIAILTSAVLAAYTFHWWAVLIVPVSILWWMGNKADSSRGNTHIWLLTLVMATAVSIHFLRLLPTPWMSGFLLVFVFSLWCDRLLYCASTMFLRLFVLRNQRALQAFGEGIIIRETDLTEFKQKLKMDKFSQNRQKKPNLLISEEERQENSRRIGELLKGEIERLEGESF